MHGLDKAEELAQLATRLKKRARRLGAYGADADDMVQETLLRLLQRQARGSVTNPQHYALIILHNIARARWRGHTATEELEESSATTQPVAESRLAVEALQGAIATLPADQAQVMALVMEGEYSPKSIATLLCLPEGTVMSRLARARVRLRAQMGLDADTPVAELL